MRFCFFFFFFLLTSSEIPLKAIRFKLLIEGAADLGDRKVFRRFPPVPTFVLHVGKYCGSSSEGLDSRSNNIDSAVKALSCQLAQYLLSHDLFG